VSVDQIKAEIQTMEDPDLQELASFLVQIRRSRDPERMDEIAEKIDRPENEWVSLDEFERRTAE
jgi:hypothetical protein